jgi:hypothetical protein
LSETFALSRGTTPAITIRSVLHPSVSSKRNTSCSDNQSGIIRQIQVASHFPVAAKAGIIIARTVRKLFVQNFSSKVPEKENSFKLRKERLTRVVCKRQAKCLKGFSDLLDLPSSQGQNRIKALVFCIYIMCANARLQKAQTSVGVP